MKIICPKPAFIDSLPALFGYFPIGLAFGILSFNTTQSFWIGPIMSLLVYAGAAQFICLNLIANNGTLIDIAITTFIVNLRHIFYGIPFLSAFKGNLLKRFYLIFGITDETYAILSGTLKRFDTIYSLWVTGLTHLYWIVGTILGSYLGSQLNYDLSALDFSLTALFIILAIEQGYSSKDSVPFILAIISFFICQLAPASLFLSLCMFVSLILTLIDFNIREKNYELS
ncbi:AzlC family ABC transporter permease [Candidatus Paracaedibacter symbiosus]|uniref:AzlC family ABC transporter permease n=1 Tax=Candidatus Paracaedibacter symbiosus TaxID=244582 RepID=UPI000509EC85|nr:AzlC family ABC transporter permease [Candidatus Paracaedibacter symbiosus]